MRSVFTVFALMSACAAAFAAEAPKPAAKKPSKPEVREVTRGAERLSNVLLMGDSIASGYSRGVGERLKGVANVDVYVTGKHVVSDLYKDITPVVAHRPYQVIHFNESTLHAWTPGRVREGQYEPAFRQYLETIRTRAPQAKLIWASGTPMTLQGKPTELDPEHNRTIVEFNRIARQAVESAGATVNDLYTLMLGHLELGAGDRFHWKKPGVEIQADAVANAIRKALSQPSAKQQ